MAASDGACARKGEGFVGNIGGGNKHMHSVDEDMICSIDTDFFFQSAQHR